MNADFPVLNRTGGVIIGCPRSVPWDLVTPHEQQAQANHSQTLKRLAERGGLSPLELYFVLRDQPYGKPNVSTEQAVAYLKARLEAFGRAQAGPLARENSGTEKGLA